MSQASKSRSISIDEVGEGATTAIKGIQVITNNEADNTSLNGIYDLQGRKLSKEPTHGIYIKNGNFIDPENSLVHGPGDDVKNNKRRNQYGAKARHEALDTAQAVRQLFQHEGCPR